MYLPNHCVHFLVVSPTIEGASSLLSFPSFCRTQLGGASHLLLQVVETRAYVVLLVCVCVCATTSVHACVLNVLFLHCLYERGRTGSQIPASLGVSCVVLQWFHLANNTSPHTHTPTPLTPIRQTLQVLPATIRSDPVNSLHHHHHTVKLQVNTKRLCLI